jgi:hypothetical protein
MPSEQGLQQTTVAAMLVKIEKYLNAYALSDVRASVLQMDINHN